MWLWTVRGSPLVPEHGRLLSAERAFSLATLICSTLQVQAHAVPGRATLAGPSENYAISNTGRFCYAFHAAPASMLPHKQLCLHSGP